MKLLEAEPGSAPANAPEAPQEQPEAVRTCRACGAPMEPDQDWCLTCGTAAAGSLGERPGWRAASTVIAITALLVIGAIVAGYAALTSEPKKQPPPPTQAQAQATPPAAAEPTQPPATTPQQTTPTQPKTNSLPKVTAPKTPSSTGSHVTPTPPATNTTPPATSSTPSTPSTSSPSTSTGTTPSTTTNQQPTPTGPTAIELADDAVTVYDPYGRAKAMGQTARAIDGDPSTSWYVDPKDPQQIGVGFAVDLGKLRGIRQIELETPTPGFRIEVYATDERELPPDILDTRWSHITNVSNVGAKDDGKEKIVLGAGSTKYRNLLLWFTQPPTDGPRLRLSELKVLG